MKKSLFPPNLLTNFEIQKYYHNEPTLNVVYSRDDLPKEIKDGAYVINLDEYFDVGTHWIALYSTNSNVTYFDSFGVEHIPKKIVKFINNESTQTNIFGMQAYDSIICGYFCFGFINFMLEGKA